MTPRAIASKAGLLPSAEALSTLSNSTKEKRSYDLSGKLTRIQDVDSSGNVIDSSVRRLDPTGRVIGENVTPAPANFSIPDATMTFDADNRLANFTGQAVSFDPDGNMTSSPSAITLNAIAYSYDARNRLTWPGTLPTAIARMVAGQPSAMRP